MELGNIRVTIKPNASAKIECAKAEITFPDGSVVVKEGAFTLCYPNPFNPTTTIEYSVPTRTHVTVEIFNILGQSVRTLVNDARATGTYRVEWNGTSDDGHQVSSGIYLNRIQAGEFVESKKMLLLK